MEIKRLEDNYKVHAMDEVRIKEMGNIIELMYTQTKNKECVIKKLNNDQYVDLRSGEIKEFIHIEHRGQDINSVRQSLSRLRDYINTNVVDVRKCKWLTLTYAENMTDPKRLMKDFEKFNKRLRYKLGHYEYIVAMEPQGRGAWHAHMLMIFDRVAERIDNNTVVWPAWGHGFTKIKKLDGIDNVGAYLTAYLGDLDFDEVENLQGDEMATLITRINGSNLQVKETSVEGKSKRFIKGGRLHMYPPKFNIYRCSKGIKKPNISYDFEKEAQKKVSAGTLTFEKTIQLSDQSNSFENIINYRQYNLIREKSK